MMRNTGTEETPTWEKWYPKTTDDAVLITDENGDPSEEEGNKTLKEKLTSLTNEELELKNKIQLIGTEYWSGMSNNIVITQAGEWVEAPNKITVPAGTYIFMAHATIPANFNKFGKIQITLEGLYEVTQSWYPSNDIIEVNLTTFMTISEQLTVGVKLTSEASVTVTSAEIAALRIK